MRNAHVRFMCFPSVACVGRETEVVIFPRDTSRIFRNEWEYGLAVVGLWDDQTDYHAPVPMDHPFEIRNGCMVFRHVFDHEQEYSIRFSKKGDVETRIAMYAVGEDLYGLRPLKGDFHTHTYYSDGQDGIAVTPADYREEGYDFMAVTDHNRMFTSVLMQEFYENMKTDMHIMRGEEIHTPGSLLHIVNAGGEKSVTDMYLSDPEGYERAVDAIEVQLSHVPETYRRRVAMARWACDNIREGGGLAIFAHPFWCPNRYNLSEEFCRILFDEKLFDALEIMGGINQVNNNLQLALWQQQRMKGNDLPVVGSTDSHNHDAECNAFAHRFSVVFARENDTQAILEAVRAGRSVAADVPLGDEKEVRFYGDLRYVMFANFLYKNYFNETWKLCVTEGMLMRRYAQGEDVAGVLSVLADSVPKFYRQYYGIDPAPVLPADRIALLDKWREVQITRGPITRGSKIVICGNNPRKE